jgi:histone H3/H4
MNDPNEWHHCSTCRKSIAFGTRYYRCSVSTCNRSRLALFFCSVECWDAHVPTLRHRDAWAEESVAPTRQEWEREREPGPSGEEPRQEPRPRVVEARPAEAPLDREILVVVSKLKQYVRARSGMNTSDAVADVLSDHVRALCDDAMDRATRDGRKTVLDRDFSAVVSRASRQS